ncbi:VOC family protein [Nocardioides sp. NBC_00368]|uniref:VOC family protein n=1 Tax=Nocardioides sp. NBC_00368 TaxID=2976000 RepID=UPI002E1A56DF
MALFVSHTTIDCHDAYTLSEWWKKLLGYVDVDGDPNLPGHEECMILDPETGHRLLFIEVPDEELPAKRIHLDLRPRTGTRDEEVERVLGLGATLVADHRGKYGPGSGWVIFADPEGNPFCVLRSEAEVAAQEAQASGS